MTLTNAQILSVYGTAEKAIRRTVARFGSTVTEDDVADMQQGTIERVLKSYDPSKGTPDALAWRIAANVATDFLRGRTTAAIKNDAESLTVEDDEGVETVADVADDSSNAFELLAAYQLDAELTRGIAALSDTLKNGIKAALSDETMSGADRIAAMRAREALAESLRASHLPVVREGKRRTKAAKRAKSAPAEVTEDDVAEVPMLRRLSTVVRMEMELLHCLKAPLVVLGPA